MNYKRYEESYKGVKKQFAFNYLKLLIRRYILKISKTKRNTGSPI